MHATTNAVAKVLFYPLTREFWAPPKTPEPSHIPAKEINEILQRPAYLPNSTRQHKPRHYPPTSTTKNAPPS